MSVELHCPPEPEESQKNSTEKNIPYPEFEPITSGLALGILNRYYCVVIANNE
jgi:hypothetical protein